MILTAFTFLHVVISLVGIVSGFVVVYGMLQGKRLEGWTLLFLTTTVATSVTGFFFPVHHFMPSHAVGILSLIALAIACFALYRRHLAGHWRAAYVITSVMALYFNFFVLIAQSFAKVPALHAAAPTQSEPPFAATQLAALIAFIVLAVTATIRFHPERAHPAV
ncbi:MAG: hypothetical protein JWP03_4113 [Phycisphaerales bacterium]|jgi:hypothetical protein|nr:hypothetical protein [Phycisphaerales bacterium]